MSDILSQAEIDALLKNDIGYDLEEFLSEGEIDALGEIGNISMGAAATTLSTVVNKRVNITTPEVVVTNLKELAREHPIPFVAVEILYTQGLQGNNLLIVNEADVKVITDLMMGGKGEGASGDLSEMHISAISEAMNQMMGSSATSLAALLDRSINISPPRAFVINFASENPYDLFGEDEPIVKVKFKMDIEDLLSSYIMQLLPLGFAKSLVQGLLSASSVDVSMMVEEPDVISKPHIQEKPEPVEKRPQQQVDVRPVTLQEFVERSTKSEKENIDLILDVPLEITVELGKSKKIIKDILELSTGSIIELDKSAGEPVDILVNGKMIAKGEVVVIDDNFGVRIIDIISPANRVMKLK